MCQKVYQLNNGKTQPWQNKFLCIKLNSTHIKIQTQRNIYEEECSMQCSACTALKE